jgi:hypothetical protein
LRSLFKNGTASVVLILLLIPWIGSISAVVAESVEYAVIASPDVTIVDLDTNQLRRIFMFRQKYWEGGTQIRILYAESDLAPDSCLLEKIYRMDYGDLRRYILLQLYSDTIQRAPKVVDDTATVIRFVASGKGLLAIVPADQIGDADVHTFSVEGLFPGADGYLLRN